MATVNFDDLMINSPQQFFIIDNKCFMSSKSAY